MNLYFINKSIKEIELKEKAINYFFKTKMGEDLNTNNGTELDYVDDLTLYGFSPFDKKTFKEQRKEMSKNGKSSSKNFNEGYTNFVHRRFQTPSKNIKLAESFSTDKIHKRFKFSSSKKLPTLLDKFESDSSHNITKLIKRSNLRKLNEFFRERIEFNLKDSDSQLPPQKEEEKKQPQKVHIKAKKLFFNEENHKKDIIIQVIEENRSKSKINKNCKSELSLKEQIKQLLSPRRNACQYQGNNFKLLTATKVKVRKSKDALLKKIEKYPKSIFKKNKIHCRVSMSFDNRI